MLGWFRRKPQDMTAQEALIALRRRVEKMNIPVVNDHYDAGYDMAVDEVLELIDEALNPKSSNDDVTYGDAV